MSSRDDEPPPPAAPSGPLPPSFLQPSRRSRIGRNTRQSQERRIPGATVPPGAPEDSPASSSSSADPDPSEPAIPTEEPPDAVPRAVAYRPPSRGTETLWAGERLEPVTETAPAGSRAAVWRLPFLLFLLGAGLGGGLGYALGDRAGAVSGAEVGRRSKSPVVDRDAGSPLPIRNELSAVTLAAVTADLDNAYGAMRAGKFADADASLRAAQERRPFPPDTPRTAGVVAGWPEVEVERARARFYAGDLRGADHALDVLLQAPGTGAVRADALLLRALLQGALRAPAAAEGLFAAAVAVNPVRSDTFFFWGNALRTQGKPAESIPKFRAALLRNQFETMDGLIRLKLWTSQLQVDTEAPAAVAAIDTALAAPNQPTGYAWMAAAARAIREGRFPEAADRIRRARPLLEPVLLRVVLSDPIFAEQSWRPELAEFFR